LTTGKELIILFSMAGSKGYGKKPLWFWVLVYVVIGGIVYYGIYYLMSGKSGGNMYKAPGSTNETGY